MLEDSRRGLTLTQPPTRWLWTGRPLPPPRGVSDRDAPNSSAPIARGMAATRLTPNSFKTGRLTPFHLSAYVHRLLLFFYFHRLLLFSTPACLLPAPLYGFRFNSFLLFLRPLTSSCFTSLGSFALPLQPRSQPAAEQSPTSSPVGSDERWRFARDFRPHGRTRIRPSGSRQVILGALD